MTDESRLPNYMIRATLGLKIQQLRNAQHLTQKSLAEKTRLSRWLLLKLETGAHDPTLTTLLEIAKALNVSLQELFTPHDSHKGKGRPKNQADGKKVETWREEIQCSLETSGDRQRFRAKISEDPIKGCWNFMSGLRSDGYCMFHMDGRSQYAHQVAYALYKGPLPEDLTLDHRCSNRRCVNPDHLEAVTMRRNQIRRSEAVKRGLRKRTKLLP